MIHALKFSKERLFESFLRGEVKKLQSAGIINEKWAYILNCYAERLGRSYLCQRSRRSNYLNQRHYC